MRSLSAFLILFFVASLSFGQTQYEKGYIIDKNNQKIECLIKNMDWKDNPTEISYKLKAKDAPLKGDYNSIKEFAIGNTYKYVVTNVKVDLLNKPTLGTQSELDPVWTRENLFLKVLLEGKAKLYGYKKGKVERFFYSVADSTIFPLTYKQIHKASILIKNNDFRQQLWDKVKIPKTTWEMMKTVDYTVNDLKDYFKTYNGNFKEPIIEIISPTTKKIYLNLRLTPGVNFSSTTLKVNESTVAKPNQIAELKFDSKPGFRLGLEAEVIIPFNSYRWGILFEPAFQSFKSEADYGTKPTTLDFKSVEFPIGLRYYVYLNNDSKVFFNGFYIPGASLNMGSKIDYYSKIANDHPMTIETSSNVAFGGGFAHKKLSIEARYYTGRDILKGHPFEFADYNRFSVIVGYKFMEKRLR